MRLLCLPEDYLHYYKGCTGLLKLDAEQQKPILFYLDSITTNHEFVGSIITSTENALVWSPAQFLISSIFELKFEWPLLGFVNYRNQVIYVNRVYVSSYRYKKGLCDQTLYIIQLDAASTALEFILASTKNFPDFNTIKTTPVILNTLFFPQYDTLETACLKIIHGEADSVALSNFLAISNTYFSENLTIHYTYGVIGEILVRQNKNEYTFTPQLFPNLSFLWPKLYPLFPNLQRQ